MTNTEARSISYNKCRVKCVGCESDCENIPIGRCKANLIEVKIKKLVDKYVKVQKKAHGDCAESKRIEAEIDELEIELKKLQIQ